MITLEISPSVWDKAVGHMVLGHTRHNAVAETALRDALKVLGIEVEFSKAATCKTCKWWIPLVVGGLRGTCGISDIATLSGSFCGAHTPEGSE